MLSPSLSNIHNFHRLVAPTYGGLVWPGDVPDLGVAVLAGGHEARVVQPRQPRYLALQHGHWVSERERERDR